MEDRSDNAIEVFDLTKRFGDFVSVDHLSFNVKSGSVFGFLGPNGAGKTTTIRMLCGILKPTSGYALVAGFNVVTDPERVKKNIGYMSQRFTLYSDLTVFENMKFYGEIYGITGAKLARRIEEMLEIMRLSGLQGRLARDLAQGHRQRLALACAIIHNPKVLFLDEPTSGVDPIARGAFWGLIYDIAKKGATVFVTTHYMDEAEFCERLGFIGNGRLIAIGSASEIKQMMGNYMIVKVSGSINALEILRRQSFIISATPFGREIHAVMPREQSLLAKIKDVFANENLTNIGIEEINPSLEDVFIHLLKGCNNRKS